MEPGREHDDWTAIPLDEAFVGQAAFTEPTAENRARLAERLRRDDELRQRLAAEQADERKQRRRTRGRRVRSGLVVLIALGGLGAAAVRFGRPGAGASADIWSVRMWDDAMPPPSNERRSSPQGLAPLLPAGGSYAFLASQPDDADAPVAYDPCRPVHYVVNSAAAPPGADRLLAAAMAEASAASGLELVPDGPTSEAPNPDRRPYQPERYGRNWAPVLIAWSDPFDAPELKGNTAGVGGSAAIEVDRFGRRRRVYVTGTIVLDGADALRILQQGTDEPGRTGEDLLKSVILHEIGHLLGLDHVDDPNELMHPTAGATTTYGPGDLTGLAALGRGECFPDV